MTEPATTLNPTCYEEFDGLRLAHALGVPGERVEQIGMSGKLIEALVRRIEELQKEANRTSPKP